MVQGVILRSSGALNNYG